MYNPNPNAHYDPMKRVKWDALDFYITIQKGTCISTSKKGLLYQHPKRVLYLNIPNGLVSQHSKGSCISTSQKGLISQNLKRVLYHNIPKGSCILTFQKGIVSQLQETTLHINIPKRPCISTYSTGLKIHF